MLSRRCGRSLPDKRGFFFQAEDGIRDPLVTGVQTCALPISAELEPIEELKNDPEKLILKGGSAIIGPDGSLLAGPVFDEETILTAELDLSRISEERSEERRVGKECRYRVPWRAAW